MAEVLGAAYKWGKTVHSFTDTDYAKQKSIEAMTGLVMLYALKKAVGGHVVESGGSMAVGAILWMNHEAIIKQNLANTAVVFSTQVDHLNGYIERQEAALQSMDGKIRDLESLKVGGAELLGHQRKELEGLRREKEALGVQIGSLSELRDQLREQVEAIRKAQTTFDEHVARQMAQIEKERASLEALKGQTRV